MAAVPLSGFPPEFRACCYKCRSRNVHFSHGRHPYMWGKSEVQMNCFVCGSVKYGEVAIQQALDPQLKLWEREQAEEKAAQVRLGILAREEKERAQRELEAAVQREREEAARAAEEAARVKAEEEARLAREAEEEQERLNRLALQLAQEEETRLAREQAEEAERAAREEVRLRLEREAAVIRAKQTEEARRFKEKFALLDTMRKRDAARVEELRRTLKRERDARYRENKRAKARAAAPVAPVVEELVAPAPVPVVVAEVVKEAASVTVPVCAWEGCANPVTGASKYCSRTCSNNNARARYKARHTAPPPASVSPVGESVDAERRKVLLGRKARYESTETTTESV